MSYASDRLRALEIAEKMLGFNARPGTICAITGLCPKEIHNLLPPGRARPGRWPSASEWYHNASLTKRVEASLFAAQYWRNRKNGFELVESLIDAYGRYRNAVGATPLISFDRAFNLVCHLEGNVWGAGPRTFDMAVCQRCNAQQLIELSDQIPIVSCIFCKLVQRYVSDPRLHDRFPARLLPDFGSTVAPETPAP